MLFVGSKATDQLASSDAGGPVRVVRLSATPHSAERQATIIATAIATFALFEAWLGGWNDNND